MRDVADKCQRAEQLSGLNPLKCGQRPHLSGANDVCDLFARNHLQRWGMGGESRLIFVTALSMQVNDTAKGGRYRKNSCLPGERETAPSLGAHLVNVGRKREAKSETAKPDGGNAWESDYGQHKSRCVEVSSCRTSQTRMIGWPKTGKVSRSTRHIADRRSLVKRPGIKHRPNVAQNGYAEQSNPLDALRTRSRQPAISPSGRDYPRSQCLRESQRTC